MSRVRVVSQITAPSTAPTPTPTLKDRYNLIKNASPLRTLSRYRIAYYCAHCRCWILKEQVLRDRSGAPRCPRCGFRFRTRPREKRWKA